jgi:WD40 repeat protein
MTTIHTPDDDLIGTSFGPFVVEALHNTTPQMTNFRGQHQHSRQPVMIRVVAQDQTDSLRDDFLTEKENLLEFDHPHILPLLDTGEAHGRLYTVTPHTDGDDLKARLGEGLLPYREVLRLVKELAAALNYAHERNMLHLNLCPESVLMDSYGNLFLGDFGLPLAAPGHYSAPERWREDDLDPRADIYALGVMLYEMITGQLPFRAAQPEDLMQQHLSAVPPLPVRPDEPAGFVNEEPVFRALTKKASRRFQSAPALAAAFEKTLAGRITRNTLKALPSAADHERHSELSARWLPSAAENLAGNLAEDHPRELKLGDGDVTITACAYAGAQVIYCTQDGRIMRWDADSPAEIASADSAISSLSISAENDRLLTTHPDGSAQLREISGALVHTLTGHDGPVLCGAIDAPGLQAVTGGQDGSLRVWDSFSGRTRLEIDAHPGGVTCCSLSENGQLVLTGGADGELHLWNTRTGDRVQSFSGHAAAVTACQLKGELAFSGASDGELRVWDILMEDGPLVIAGHSGAVTAVHVQEFGARVQGIASSEDGSISVWDVRSGDGITRFAPDSGPIRCIAVSGRRVLSGGASLTVFSIPQPIQLVDGHNRRALGAVVSKKTIFSISVDGAIRQTDAERGTILNETILSAAPRCLQVNQDYVFVGTLDGLLKCYDRTSFRLRWEASAHQAAVRFIALEDQNRIVSGGADGVLALWNTVNGARLSAVALKTGGVRCGAQLGAFIVVGNQEGGVAGWDVMTGAQRQLYGEFLSTVTACAAQEHYVIAGLADGSVYRWPLDSDEAAMGFQAHRANVTVLAAHPDQRTLLTADSSGGVSLWDVEAGVLLEEWTPPAPVTAVCWADEHTLILTDEAGGLSALAWTPLDL